LPRSLPELQAIGDFIESAARVAVAKASGANLCRFEPDFRFDRSSRFGRRFREFAGLLLTRE
jgi:hypothetical protein